MRLRAEAVASENAARSAENLESLSPEEIGRILHELRVHRIELEMQNDELRRAQEELEAARAKYFDLFDLAPVGYFTVDVTGLILEANLRGADLLGLERKGLIRERLNRYVVPEDQDVYYLHRKRLMETGERKACELRMCRRDGSRFWGQLEMVVEPDGGNEPSALRILLIDITERKREGEKERNFERQVRDAQKLQSLGVMAGGIAHDFNNLLTAVLGNAELALNEIPPGSPALRSLAEIHTAAQRAADLSLRMLEYAGKAQFTREQVDLRGLVEEMAPRLRAQISKIAVLDLRLEEKVPPIQGDPERIRQVVMDLVVNASEAIGDRSGAITVSLGAVRCDEECLRKLEPLCHLPPGLYVRLVVTDTGVGMDEQTRARIFEPFFSTKFSGRGLGLAAVQGIVRAHKGGVQVESEPGKGSTFKVLFPTLEEADTGAGATGTSRQAGWRGKGTILLVDDEESLLALGSRMLDHLGFTVLTARNGREAVDHFRARGKEVDLVLMDLTMPEMDGAEAFDELRRLDPSVRIVLASGYTQEAVASRFEGKGLEGVLQKPYTLARLRAMLAAVRPERQQGEG